MTITGPTDAIFKAFAMIAYKFEEVRGAPGEPCPRRGDVSAPLPPLPSRGLPPPVHLVIGQGPSSPKAPLPH